MSWSGTRRLSRTSGPAARVERKDKDHDRQTEMEPMEAEMIYSLAFVTENARLVDRWAWEDLYGPDVPHFVVVRPEAFPSGSSSPPLAAGRNTWAAVSPSAGRRARLVAGGGQARHRLHAGS